MAIEAQFFLDLTDASRRLSIFHFSTELYVFLFSVEGKTFLDKVASMHTITEDDVASFIKQLLEILKDMHSKNLVHLDLRVRITSISL